ncbi:MAG: glycosyltransferase family 2 protein [Deltaproteobacteria bacterium]
MSQKLLSVVICTCGRSQLLRGAIESLVTQSFPTDEYEILIVDDHANDDTHEVVRQLSAKHSQVRYILNKGRGLLPARHTGQTEAIGRYIGYFDDDAKACGDWLERASGIIRERAPICFGGPFFPFYISKKPKWYKDEYGSMTRGDTARILDDDEVLCGGNVFFEGESLRNSGGFDPEFCKPGDRWTYGDEEIPQLRLRASFPGREFYYDPKLYILHIVRPERLNIVRAAREAFAMGRAYVKVNPPNMSESRWFPFAWRLGYRYLKFAAGILIAMVYRNRDQYPSISNYIYEEGFGDLRAAGVFYQNIHAVIRRERD